MISFLLIAGDAAFNSPMSAWTDIKKLHIHVHFSCFYYGFSFAMITYSCRIVVRLLISLCTIGQTVASSAQQPLLDSDNSVTESRSGWNFNFSSSAPHYFASVYGLLQQWPNTFFPNGQSIAPCQIPAFTKLYHGRQDGDVPPSPEWVAFDMFVIGCHGGTPADVSIEG